MRIKNKNITRILNVIKSIIIRDPRLILPEKSKDGGKYLNLGCGDKIFEGDWVNFDSSSHSSANMLGDINDRHLPFEDSFFEGIYADNILEHVEDLINVMNECWRILKPDGIFEIIVPHEKSVWAWADPKHKRVFNKRSWEYFSDVPMPIENLKQSYGIKCDFHVERLYAIRPSNERLLHVILKKIL